MNQPGMFHSVEQTGFVSSQFEGYVTTFAPHKALKLITTGKLTFDERVELNRVGCQEEEWSVDCTTGGYFTHKKTPIPLGPPRTLGIGPP